DQITAILDDPSVDPLDHLRRQHQLLTGRIDELRRMVGAIEKTMEARSMGINLDPQEMFEVFGHTDVAAHHAEAEQRWGHTDVAAHHAEAEQRWGHTDAWKESQRRTAGYTKDDWKRATEEMRRGH